jgi:hypothetical protein
MTPELRDRRPVGVDLDALPQFGRVIHIERLVTDSDVFENLNHMTRKSALWKLRRAFYEEQMSFERNSFSMNCSILMISSLLVPRDATAPLIARPWNEQAFAVEANNCWFRYSDDNHHIQKLRSAPAR